MDSSKIPLCPDCLQRFTAELSQSGKNTCPTCGGENYAEDFLTVEHFHAAMRFRSDFEDVVGQYFETDAARLAHLRDLVEATEAPRPEVPAYANCEQHSGCQCPECCRERDKRRGL